MDHLCTGSFSAAQISTCVRGGGRYAQRQLITGSCAKGPAALASWGGAGLRSDHLSMHHPAREKEVLKPLLTGAAHRTAPPGYTEDIASAMDTALPILHPEGLYEAMRYAARGTHIFGFMCLCACEVVGGKAGLAMPMACATEMWLASAVIQDDFPCLDDADMRRGRPSTHKAFGESTAFLAATTLIGAAFEQIVKRSTPWPEERKVRLVQELGRAGVRVGCGQYVDMQELAEGGGDAELERLVYMNTHKAAVFFEVPVVCGAIVGGGSDEQVERLRKFGRSLGLMFALLDDVADATLSADEMGKNPGTDSRNNKRTFFTVLGHQKCIDMAHDLSRKAKMQLSAFENPTVLADLVDQFMAHGVTLNNPNHSPSA